jgi:hypothetical protein
MNVVLELSQFNINDVYFQEPVKNTIMDNSNFIRVIYSNSIFMLNGIFIRFNLNVLTIEKSFNKYKCMFDKQYNNAEILVISTIERELLSKMNIIGKTPIYRISEQLVNGHVKIFIDNNNTTNNKRTSNEFIMKISGIWENEFEYGLTYKFTEEKMISI